MDGGWQVFIAYPSAERQAADDLYRELSTRGIRTFLDHECLEPGDIWPATLAAAQRTARVTAVLVSANPAFYQQDEVTRAIALLREDAERHRVVPVYLDASADPPFGLHGIHAIVVSDRDGMAGVAARLASLVAAITTEADFRSPNLDELGVVGGRSTDVDVAEIRLLGGTVSVTRPDGDVVELRGKSASLLGFLASRSGSAATVTDIIGAVWPEAHDPDLVGQRRVSSRS